jgi:hypothetical protein
MIDLATESLLSITDAAKSLPGRPHVSTLHRWRLRGIRGIKLETILLGGKRLTSREALQRFADRTTAAASGEPVSVRTPTQRAKAIGRAERECDRMGV